MDAQLMYRTDHASAFSSTTNENSDRTDTIDHRHDGRRFDIGGVEDGIYRVLLEARVAALESQLERKEQQLHQIRHQYESVLATREGSTPEVVGSWSRPK